MNCDHSGLFCINVVTALMILLLGITGGRFPTRNQNSTKRNIFTMIFILGYGFAVTIIPSIFIAILHIHFDPNIFFHFHSISEISMHFGPITVDRSLMALITILTFVFVFSFEVSQFTMNKFVQKLYTFSQPKLAKELKEKYQLPMLKEVKLIILTKSKPDAFSFTILRRRYLILPIKKMDFLVLTTGLLDLLTEAELETVLAHELAHVTNRDTVFVPFFRMISSLMFFDPLLKLTKNRIIRSREFLADEGAALQTKRPRDLARALLKIISCLNVNPGNQASVSIFGRQTESFLLKRIERLIELAKKLDSSP